MVLLNSCTIRRDVYTKYLYRRGGEGEEERERRGGRGWEGEDGRERRGGKRLTKSEERKRGKGGREGGEGSQQCNSNTMCTGLYVTRK